MDVITQWVTQIIVFILLATIIDLIIPATSMKKYIKLVVGLILILIFLKPVFYLFNINIHQSLETAYSQLYEEEMENQDIENQIKMQKNEIQASQDAYILEEMTVQLKNLAKDPLREIHQAEITDIQFEFSKKEKVSYEDLEKVIVYLQELKNGEGEVNTVENIQINTEEPLEDEKDEQMIEEMEALLRDTWDLNNKKLKIIWEGGTS
ncbi:stage III sporulation protein AF [Virgibacillus alimentarius]|uniref:Stage III sporulation protein AF n=1 Tax=Virgibacillus alimentarius TaxID=698769 RepID=A0ABS4S7U9_9BACI|nr:MULTISPECIES: stage III sporulation protein AF [Virgibacillus]MBP2256477.1 stage III sporulation protein AF [Virgibacillus alimentarius]HLR66422.1 stage III sporulation protein AF [Virgibacillus sp.]